MDKVAFVKFLKEAKNQGATGKDVAVVLKEAIGEDIDPAQLEAMMAQMHQGASDGEVGGPPQPQDPNAGAPSMPPHPGHPGSHSSHSGHPGHSGSGMPISEEQINEIAMLIAQHLQEQEAQGGGMGAQMQGLPPEQQQGLEMAKSSEYIEEFIKRGMEHGLSPDESVNVYCNYIGEAIQNFKIASERNLGVFKTATDVDEETLSYYQGVAEKAASANLTYEQTLELLKKQGADKILKDKFTIIK